MAKLNAHGRKEIARLEKAQTEDRDSIQWSRTTFALMSDGNILQKYDVEFRADALTSSYKHSYGWKRVRAWKGDKESFIQALSAKGFTLK